MVANCRGSAGVKRRTETPRAGTPLEAVEAALASVSGNKQHLAAESADVLYHLLVLWAAAGITPDDVYAVLRSREAQAGLAEKASRKS